MGPLAGVRIVELAGIGPGPLAAMLLADLGATVIRIDRKEPSGLGLPRPLAFDLGLRNRKSIRVDLKDPASVSLVLDLVERADALIEGFRPGVAERLGVGPKPCLERNPKLVYGRVTGWGQDGPLAQAAGHDLNYIAITGVLNAIGREGEPPAIPLNLIGDYAGGSLYLAFGLLAGILEARTSGPGPGGRCRDRGRRGFADDRAHWPARGRHEHGRPWNEPARFGRTVLRSLRVRRRQVRVDRADRAQVLCAAAGAIGAGRSRTEETRRISSTGLQRSASSPRSSRRRRGRSGRSCSRVPTSASHPCWISNEAHRHPHLQARKTFVEVAGVMQPAPAPRFSRTPPDMPRPPAEPSADALCGWLTEEEIAALAAAGVL